MSRAKPRGLSRRERALKAHLEAFLASRRAEALSADPIRFPRRYPDPPDREVVALLSALFAYGNVAAIGSFLERLTAALGPSPAAALRMKQLPRCLPSHRFQTEADVRAILRAVGALLSAFGSLEAAFLATPGPLETRLEAFALRMRAAARLDSPGVRHLLPLPSAGSACKRWWMFLRWMVRPDDGVDLGLWQAHAPSELRIPVDTHVARIAKALGLTRRATPDAAFSREVTAALARLCPEDPVRFDFALAHMGILRACPTKPSKTACASCGARGFCTLTP